MIFRNIKHFIFGHDWFPKGTLERPPTTRDLVYDMCRHCGAIRWRMGGLKMSIVNKAVEEWLGDGIKKTLEKETK